jgi:RNA polymerase sigma-70 factor (ECF subfamily)
MLTNEQKFPSIAHCAMQLIFQYKDWTNKKIADEVARIMGSRTGPGNISWYKGMLKKGELKMEDYIDFKTTKPVEEIKAPQDDIEVQIPAELIVTEDDIIQAKGLQKLALEFFKQRDEKSFNKLYARLKPGMLYHAMNLLKDEAAADDVVSIAFTKIWLKIEQYNKYWNFSTWAYRIVHNEAMQHIRKNKMLIGIEGPSVYNNSDRMQYNETSLVNRGAEEELLFVEPDWNLDETEDMHQAVYEKVLKDINGLSKFYKEIMIDREINEMKYKQIAEKYNININSVKTRIKRARMQIIENNPEYYKLVQARNKNSKQRDDDESEFEQEINDARLKCQEVGTDLLDLI